MREEKVTIHILNWLEANEWKIICYDFPQSGTGILIHPNIKETKTTKNKGGVIPDIIAVKMETAVFFENKDRYVKSDFDKLRKIKLEGNYSDGLAKLLEPYQIKNIFYGIGIPNRDKDITNSIDNLQNIDFLIGVNEDGSMNLNIDRYEVFSNE